MLKYKKTPGEILKIINLFSKNRLKYNLFKCEKIFNGENANLDILFKNDIDYKKASLILEKNNFKLYLSEKVERYKKMYVKVIKSELCSIHLHREVAWHGIKVLNKEHIFSHQKKDDKIIIIPSNEDSLLIHVAHILFENFKINSFERNLIKTYLSKKVDWDYINKQLKENKLKKEFYKFLDYFKSNKKIGKLFFIKTILLKCLRNPSNLIHLLFKLIKKLFRGLSLRRKGCLIALIGVNGSGKTTLTRKTLEQYSQISRFFNGQSGYYFGWEPFFFITKIISKWLKKSGKELSKELKEKRFSLIKEIVFIYNYFEYLLRYLFVIYPKLKKNKLVITDRYFYDIYGQNNYAEKSKIMKLLLPIYPKPDYVFVLDAELETITKRGKDTKLFSKMIKRSEKRKVHAIEDLINQKKRYNYISTYFKGEKINTGKSINQNTEKIIQKTWVKLIR